MKIGYARVSTEDQTLSLQLDALRAAGCEVIHEDKGISGAAATRPGLTAALAALSAGDVLVVWRVDRLGRTTAGLAVLLDDLHQRGVEFRSIMDNIDTTTATGRAVFGIMGVMAQLERDLIVERTRAGMRAAKRRGKHVGRPATMTPERLDLAERLMLEGKGRAETARMVGVSTATLRRHLNAGSIGTEKRAT